MWSISGLVRMHVGVRCGSTSARRTGCRRRTSQRRGRGPATRGSVRSWSWARALVGKIEQRRVAPTAGDRLDDRHLVAERLARSGAGGDHDVAPVAKCVDGLSLVRPEGVDAPAAQAGVHEGREGGLGRGGTGGPRREHLVADDPVEVLVREGAERDAGVGLTTGRRLRGGANGSGAPRRRRSRRADESASPVLTRLLPGPAPTGRTTFLMFAGSNVERELAHVEQVADADTVELGVLPQRGDEAHGVARARVLRLQRLERGDDQQPLVARAGEVTVVERVPVAGELAVPARRSGAQARRRSARRRSRRSSPSGC